MKDILLLTKLFELNQLPSAILIEGTKENASKVIHELIAKWFCATHDSCGACQGCLLFKEGEHPDFHYIKPLQEGHAIKVEQIRDLNQLVIQTPTLLPFQIVALASADTMNMYASNALLKMLEEPNLNVHFILFAENIRFLPKTILSRCWKLSFKQELPLNISDLNANVLDDSKLKLVNSAESIKLNLSNFIQEKLDLMGCLKIFDAYSVDDSLWLLQLMTQDIIQEHLNLKNSSAIALTVALPIQIWWKFWDKILVLRKQLRTQTSLQGSLILSELFLTLKGY